MVPRPLAPLLGLLDGTRDLDGLRSGLLLRTGVQLLPSQVESFVKTLDDAFFLDNQRFRDAMHQALVSYRTAPFRTPGLAGGGYPEDGTELLAALDEYCRDAQPGPVESVANVVGVVSPHIDFPRGWRTYAETWLRVKKSVEAADLVILLGTDHSGSLGSMTLTRQEYATPWGSLPTDTDLVDRLTEILGEEDSFREEVHHVGEHSIELASVWLHYVAGGEPKTLLPILCGPHETLLEPNGRETTKVWDVLSFLSDVAAQRNTLVVAAGDLSHMGPAFGDSLPLDMSAKARIRASDEDLLEAACSGSSEQLTDYLLEKGDPTRVCGADPIHYMLTILKGSEGEVVAYDQCPADEEFGSMVSIAGVLFSRQGAET